MFVNFHPFQHEPRSHQLIFFLCVCVCVFFAVVKTTVLLADMNDFNNVNEVYKQCKLHYILHYILQYVLYL